MAPHKVEIKAPPYPEQIGTRPHDPRPRNPRPRRPGIDEPTPPLEVRTFSVEGENDEARREERNWNEGVEGEAPSEVGEDDCSERLVSPIQPEGDSEPCQAEEAAVADQGPHPGPDAGPTRALGPEGTGPEQRCQHHSR